MTWRLRRVLRALLPPRAAERELDEEMRYHLDRLIEEHRARGLDAREARAAALRSFGGLEQAKEGCRDARGTRWIEDLARDLRHGWRGLRRRPMLALVVALTLGVGIGASAAVFGLVDAVLLRPMAAHEPHRLALLSAGAQIGIGGPLEPGRVDVHSYPLFERLRAESRSFSDLAAQQSSETSSLVRRDGGGVGAGGDLGYGRAVSANYFDVLGVPAHRGRLFQRSDQTAPGADPVVVLAHRYWQRRFGGDPALIGGALTINGARYTVIGVAAPRFTGTRMERVTDFWVPATMQATLWRSGQPALAEPEAWWLLLIGRLAPGVSLASAESEVNVILQRYLADHPALARPEDRPRIHIGLDPGTRGTSEVRPFLRDSLRALAAGAGLLLLIVCFNLVHLLSAQALARRRELGVRLALGASRGRLLRQSVAESMLLAALGGLAALAFTRLLTAGLLAMIPTDGTSLAIDIDPGARSLAFSALLVAGCGLLLGLVPAWHASRVDPQRTLRAGPSALSGAPSPQRVSRLLLVSQVALSLVLLVGAGLLGGSLRRLRALDQGFDSTNVLLIETNVKMSGLTRSQAASVYDRLLAAVGALPGVRAVSLSANPFLSGAWSARGVRLPGAPGGKAVEVGCNIVTPAYHEALGMRLLRGRLFSRADHAGAPRVAIVNQAFARRHLGGREAVGLRFGLSRDRPTEIEVVGVVRDARVLGPRDEAPPMYYLPAAQEPTPLHGLEVRVDGDPGALVDPVRRTIAAVSPGLPILGVRTMASQLDRPLTRERLLSALSGGFALAALFLICVGLYGVLAQRASQRTAEIGLRMALGARPRHVRWMVLRETLVVVGAGVAVGLPASFAASRLVQSLLFGLRPGHPPLLALATLALLAVAAVAAYLPARRASRVDPMLALRAE
jgi:predicted permease